MSEFRWTAEQAAAIQAAGHTMLVASAGTGKTTTVIGKILWHLGLDVGVIGDSGEEIPRCPEERRLGLEQVAAITFTEKAAYDLKKKLRQEIEKKAPQLVWDLDRATVGTIHSFCGDLLREGALRFEIDPAFRILDERETRIDQDDVVGEVVLRALEGGDEDAIALVQKYGVEGWTRTKGAVDYVRELMRDLRWHPDRYADWSADGELDIDALREAAGTWSDEDDLPDRFCIAAFRMAREALTEWKRYQEAENVRDFDSLILDTQAQLTSEDGLPALLGIRRRYRLLVIDEFQDTDSAQKDIAFAIAGITDPDVAVDDSVSAGPTPPQLFLVGDPKQSIYRFRHADIAVWNQACAWVHADLAPLELTYNFRSDPEVVEVVNRICGPLMAERATLLAAETPETIVDYAELYPARRPSGVAGVEWLEASGATANPRREQEAERVAAKIRQLVDDGAMIVNPDPGADGVEQRPCAYRDIALLIRSRHLEHYEKALQHYGIRYYLAGEAGMTGRQEILDLLTVLRLLENPRDDLRAFAYLRSPFVGLRDEAIARIRLDGRGDTLLRQALRCLKDGEWFDAPESAEISKIEREALRIGLDVIGEMAELRSRLPIDQLLEEVLDRTGYRLHIMLRPQPEPKLANIQRFLRLLQGYRQHTLGTFLEIWDRWEDQDLGIPQAALYSKGDDVVTISTVHAAKGLEWPIVFLIDSDGGLDDKLSNKCWTDRHLGPVLCLSKNDRGDRARRLHMRETLEAHAEEARLVYVSTTRARDRLILAGPIEKAKGVGAWLRLGLDDDVPVHTTTAAVEIPTLPPEPDLSWLADVEGGEVPSPLVAPLRMGRRGRFRSATELMAHERSRREWVLKYWHGVTPPWYFAPESEPEDEIPAWVRGVVIHGVLEKLQEEADIAELLDETIGALDSPELEERMALDTEYRRALESEIEQVIKSGEWKSYIQGEHYRELPFVQFVTQGKWRTGAFDLFRLGDPSWIVDFKTHDIGPDEVKATAQDYRLQALLYATAARALGSESDVRLHFTRPNRALVVYGG
jgi:ATP-dependent helicase/nuclease subunit A